MLTELREKRGEDQGEYYSTIAATPDASDSYQELEMSRRHWHILNALNVGRKFYAV